MLGLVGHRLAIGFHRAHMQADGFSSMFDRFFDSATLAEAARQRRHYD